MTRRGARILDLFEKGPYKQDDLHPASPRFGIRPGLLVPRLNERNWIDHATCRVVGECPLWVFVSQCFRGSNMAAVGEPAFLVEVCYGVRPLWRYGAEFETLSKALAYAHGEDGSLFAQESRAPRAGEAPPAHEPPRFVLRYRRDDHGMVVGSLVLQLDRAGQETGRWWREYRDSQHGVLRRRSDDRGEVPGESTEEAGRRILPGAAARIEAAAPILARASERRAELEAQREQERLEVEAAQARAENDARAARLDPLGGEPWEDDEEYDRDEDEACREEEERIVSPACPFCGCQYVIEEEIRPGDTARAEYDVWRAHVLPADWKCPHFLLGSLFECWDFQIDKGPLSPAYSEDWLVGPRDQGFRLLAALERLRDRCEDAGEFLDDVLRCILPRRPAWYPADGSGVDRSLRWITRVPRFGVRMDRTTDAIGGLGVGSFPAYGYYAEDPERAKWEISVYLDEQAKRLEG